MAIKVLLHRLSMANGPSVVTFQFNVNQFVQTDNFALNVADLQIGTNGS